MEKLKKFLVIYIGVIFVFIICTVFDVPTMIPGKSALDLFLEPDGLGFISITIMCFILSLFI